MARASWLRFFERMLEFFCTLFGMVLGVLIVLMCADIAMRNLRIGSIPWLIELTEYLIYGGTFLAAPFVLRKGSHVRVDVVLASLPKRAAIRLEQMIDLVGLGISLTLLYYGTAAAADALRTDMVQFKTWNTPEWLLLLPIPVGCALLAIEFLLRIFRVEGAVHDDYDPTKRASM